MNVFELFPIPAAWDNLAGHFDEREIGAILGASSNQAEWHLNQGKNYLHPDWYILDKYAPTLKEAITKKINWYLREIWGENGNIRVTISWVNYNPPGTKHHKHSHPNSIFSGCFYIDTAPDAGAIIISNPNKKQFYAELLDKNRNKFSSPIFGFRPEKYDLYVFPSWLDHEVEKNKSNSTRISLAFNTFYTGTIGSLEEATELIIDNHDVAKPITNINIDRKPITKVTYE